jgi:cell division protein FtsZ
LSEDCIELRKPALLIGIGKIGKDIVSKLNDVEHDFLLISNNKEDLEVSSSLHIDCKSWINPSTYKIRSFLEGHKEEICSKLSDYQTIILVTSLGEKTGIAIAPIISHIAKNILNKRLISVVTMPFGHEKDRLFQASISLKRISLDSDINFVVDNDAYVEINPHLTIEDCSKLTDEIVLNTIKLIPQITLNLGTNLVSGTLKENNIEVGIKDLIAQLYSSLGTSSITKSVLYVNGARNEPIGRLNEMLSNFQNSMEGDTNDVSFVVTDSSRNNMHLIASIKGRTKFDSYDPLNLIPDENILDWDIPESHPNINLPLPLID